MTNIGLILSIIGSLALIISNMPILLLTGRVLQGLSAACLLPSTIALINQFLLVKNGKSFKFLVIWLLWWYRFSVIIRWYYCNLGWRFGFLSYLSSLRLSQLSYCVVHLNQKIVLAMVNALMSSVSLSL